MSFSVTKWCILHYPFIVVSLEVCVCVCVTVCVSMDVLEEEFFDVPTSRRWKEWMMIRLVSLISQYIISTSGCVRQTDLDQLLLWVSSFWRSIFQIFPVLPGRYWYGTVLIFVEDFFFHLISKLGRVQQAGGRSVFVQMVVVVATDTPTHPHPLFFIHS